MKSVHKSVLIWYSAEEMFGLVQDVAAYPDFLPWCEQAQVLEEDAGGMKAQVGIAFAGLRQSFTTRNTHVPGRQIDLALVDGPFSHLEGHWRFTPVGEPGERACKVELSLDYAFRSATLAGLVGPVFDKIAGSLVEAFVKRAGQVLGD